MTDAPILRDYQARVIDRVYARVAGGKKRILLVAPTGAGKTVIASALIGDAVREGRRALFLAHRRELITQASAKLFASGISHGVMLPGFPSRPSEPVQVASIPTFHSRVVRSASAALPPADLLIMDEAHHCNARTWRQIMDTYPAATIVGVTATPCRSDGRGLGNIFETLVECPPVADLIRDKFLVGTQVYAPSRPNLTGVRVQRGDYVEKDLAPRMDQAKLIGDIVTHWLRLGERRPTVVFASSVGHSVHLRDEFRRAGVVAEHVDGTTPADQRDAILAALSSGAVEVVTNFAVLCEGWDCPCVSCVVLARPTKHHGLFRQMIGRVLRPVPGKTNAIVLDHAGATFEHGFIEEPVQWTLSPDRRAEKPRQIACATSHAAALTTCPECAAVRFEGQPCRACGWQPRRKPEPVAVADGELGLVGRNRAVKPPKHDPAEQLRFLAQLLWIARERGYRPGWAAHKFKERFEKWPSRGQQIEPQPPEAAVRAWVRSRAIAWARAQEKASAA